LPQQLKFLKNVEWIPHLLQVFLKKRNSVRLFAMTSIPKLALRTGVSDTVLRTLSRAFKKEEILSPQTKTLIDKMREIMRAEEGIGLAGSTTETYHHILCRILIPLHSTTDWSESTGFHAASPSRDASVSASTSRNCVLQSANGIPHNRGYISVRRLSECSR
jgi:hypothetical protein